MHGKHTLKYGVDFRRQQRNFFQLAVPRGYMNFGGGFTADLSTATGGNGPADLLFGVPQATEQDTLDGLYPTRYWDLAEYVQDDWRILQNLTINLGLRYEVASPANGRVANFDLTKAVMVASYGPARYLTPALASISRIGDHASASRFRCRITRSCAAPLVSSTRPRQTPLMISDSIRRRSPIWRVLTPLEIFPPAAS